MSNKIFIGIDPGVKTGLAVWNTERKKLTVVGSMSIILAMDIVTTHFKMLKDFGALSVYIENPNLRKWYGSRASQKQQGAGSIKRDFSIWVEFLQHHNIPYEEVNPKNVLTKMDAKAFASITGWPGKTNEHSRDAAMLVYGR